jgi:hypothetical protein
MSNAPLPEPVQRLMRFAGKKRNEVSNPCLTAREAIVVANHIAHAAAVIAPLLSALTKIDAIRNSIIGAQKVNWSEHVYPLVAALDEAGFPGQPYEQARENVGTLIDQIKKAEDENARLRERVRVLEDALREAADDIEEWGSYASDYFIKKWNLQGDIDSARAALKGASHE